MPSSLPVSGNTAPVASPSVTPGGQPDSPASAAPAGKTRDGRQVSAGGAQSPLAPALAGDGQPAAAGPARTVTAADGEAANQPGELRQPNLQRASLLRRLAHDIRDAVGRLAGEGMGLARLSANKLRAAFGFEPRTPDPGARGGQPAGAAPGGPDAAHAADAQQPASPFDAAQALLADIAVQGINAGKRNFAQKIAGKQHSFEQVSSAFTGGDAGIRKATTGLYNLGHKITPPADLPAAWSDQLQALSGLARRVGEAEFSKAVPGNFLQYGDPGELNPYESRLQNEAPQLELQVRAWVGEGLELAGQLAAACQRACPQQGEPQAPFAKGELAALDKRVSDFKRGGGPGLEPTMEQELNRRLDEANREPGAEEFQGWTEAQLLEREMARNQVFAEDRERGIQEASTESAPEAESAPEKKSAPEREAPAGEYLELPKDTIAWMEGTQPPGPAQGTQDGQQATSDKDGSTG